MTVGYLCVLAKNCICCSTKVFSLVTLNKFKTYTDYFLDSHHFSPEQLKCIFQFVSITSSGQFFFSIPKFFNDINFLRVSRRRK